MYPMSPMRVLAAAATVLVLAGLSQAIAADPPSKDQIVRSLAPKTLTRTLGAAPSDQARQQQEFIDTLAKRPTRAITVEERKQVTEIVQDKPAIDLMIFFDYDRATLRPEARATLAILGSALTDSRLAGQSFLIAGHTDAAGSAEYNQQLSEARAEAVKLYLVQNHGLDSGKLLALGFGKEHLKDARNPLSGENRRVQVVTLTGN
jgi:outer membrane protein OmpA-like peptidoglycan-associated protein